jgi:hypothetical protein
MRTGKPYLNPASTRAPHSGTIQNRLFYPPNDLEIMYNNVACPYRTIGASERNAKEGASE